MFLIPLQAWLPFDRHTCDIRWHLQSTRIPNTTPHDCIREAEWSTKYQIYIQIVSYPNTSTIFNHNHTVNLINILKDPFSNLDFPPTLSSGQLVESKGCPALLWARQPSRKVGDDTRICNKKLSATSVYHCSSIEFIWIHEFIWILCHYDSLCMSDMFLIVSELLNGLGWFQWPAYYWHCQTLHCSQGG